MFLLFEHLAMFVYHSRCFLICVVCLQNSASNFIFVLRLSLTYCKYSAATLWILDYTGFVSLLHRGSQSSNSSMSNLGYLQTSLKDPLLSVSLFCHLASIILCTLILSETLALYKSFTYLLINL